MACISKLLEKEELLPMVQGFYLFIYFLLALLFNIDSWADCSFSSVHLL